MNPELVDAFIDFIEVSDEVTKGILAGALAQEGIGVFVVFFLAWFLTEGAVHRKAFRL